MPTQPMLSWKSAGAKKDIQQLFNVMDDGRKGYVSGADLMTLQAVDAANLSENDLQVGRNFQGCPNRGSGKCPTILKRWDQVKFEKVVGIGTPKKQKDWAIWWSTPFQNFL